MDLLWRGVTISEDKLGFDLNYTRKFKRPTCMQKALQNETNLKFEF